MHKPILIIGPNCSGKSTFAKQFLKNTNHIYATQEDIDDGTILQKITNITEFVVFDGISIRNNKPLEQFLFLPPWFYQYVDVGFIVITNETLEYLGELKESFHVIECPIVSIDFKVEDSATNSLKELWEKSEKIRPTVPSSEPKPSTTN